MRPELIDKSITAPSWRDHKDHHNQVSHSNFCLWMLTNKVLVSHLSFHQYSTAHDPYSLPSHDDVHYFRFFSFPPWCVEFSSMFDEYPSIFIPSHCSDCLLHPFPETWWHLVDLLQRRLISMFPFCSSGSESRFDILLITQALRIARTSSVLEQ